MKNVQKNWTENEHQQFLQFHSSMTETGRITSSEQNKTSDQKWRKLSEVTKYLSYLIQILIVGLKLKEKLMTLLQEEKHCQFFQCPNTR